VKPERLLLAKDAAPIWKVGGFY